ncbi:hypothetical protein VQ042_14435 [Aurantimonas sp. A2-1-M11]|uniref:hypothetical protein n=1 Tax=Aurantimonas sp. A2-1-M11 TaxID=3113712 RepID=UPI002F92D7FE
MNFVAAIAICLNAIPVAECQRSTAVHWLPISEPSTGLADCMRDGMISAARSRLLEGGDYPKVFCRPAGQRTADASPRLTK